MSNEQINQDNIDVEEIVNVSKGYSEALLKIQQLEKEEGEVTKHIKGDMSIVLNKLSDYSNLTELKSYIKTDEHVNELFVGEDGATIEFIIDNDHKPTDKELTKFKRDLLIYLYQSNQWKYDLENELKKFEKERAEIEKSMGKSTNEIIVSQLELALEKQKTYQNEPNTPKQSIKSINHIVSGFDFNVEIEVIKEYPSIIKNTISDMKRDSLLIGYGQRYRSAIKKANSLVSLIPFISNAPCSSIEEIYLPHDKYKQGYENLFLFSIIRYFAVQRWTEDTKRMHVMTISLLQQFVNNELPEHIQKEYINNIVNYLNIFYKEL